MSLSVLQRHPPHLPKEPHSFPSALRPSPAENVSAIHTRHIEPASTSLLPLMQLHDSRTSSGVHRTNTIPPNLESLPIELLHKVYENCPDIQSVMNLAASSRHFHDALSGGYKIKVMEKVMERQYGPLSEAKQLITYNSSQAVHSNRNPPMSLALAEQIVRVGTVVTRWEKIYPLLRWRVNSDERRFLTSTEAYRFRRAVYRWWLYAKAYHSEDWALNNSHALVNSRPDARVDFFIPYNYYEICEIAEVFDVLYEMVLIDLAPSDATVQSRFEQVTSTREVLYFGSYETHPRHVPDVAGIEVFPTSPWLPNDNRSKLPHEFVRESWGPAHEQVFKVLRIMQLDPQELLHFREGLICKAERLEYLNNNKSYWWNRNIASTRTAISFALSRRNQHPPSRSDVEGGILDFLNEDQEYDREMGIVGDDSLLFDHLDLSI